MITANPVIIRVTQPIRNSSATVIDLDGLTGEAAIGVVITTSSRGTLTVSCSSTAVFICFILSDLAEVSNNTLAKYPLPCLTLAVLFPSLIYNLRFASNLYMSLLPSIAKTGNYTNLHSSVGTVPCACPRVMWHTLPKAQGTVKGFPVYPCCLFCR